LLILEVAMEPVHLVFEDVLGALIEFRALTREDFGVHHRAFDTRRAIERGVLDVPGLFAEDRAQKFLFRRELSLALRRDLAHEDVARLHRCADADNSALVEL